MRTMGRLVCFFIDFEYMRFHIFIETKAFWQGERSKDSVGEVASTNSASAYSPSYRVAEEVCRIHCSHYVQ